MAPPSKRRKIEQPAELTFDPAARQEYLTGYHKRKVQRTKQAQEVAAKKAREERIRDRKELREQRKREAEQRVLEVNAFLKKQADSSEEGNESGDGDDAQELTEEGWEGIEEPVVVDGEDEYVDEGKFTTVTVRELDDVRDFESDQEKPDESAGKADSGVEKNSEKKDVVKKKHDHDRSSKRKKRSFRYESKLERKTERKKQRLKKSAAAIARKGK